MLLTVVRRPHVVRVVASSLVGRLPSAAAALAISLALRDAGQSYHRVGVVLAVTSVAMAVGGPLLGRLVDRRGQGAVLLTSSVLAAAGFALIALAPGSAVVVLAGAVLAGAATPPLEPCLRALWPGLVEPAQLDAALSLDAAAQELVFIAGPLLVAGCAAAGSPVAALWLAAALGVAGAAAFARSGPSRRWRPTPGDRNWLGPLTGAGLRWLLAALLFSGSAIGALNLIAVAYAERQHVAGGAGTLLALNATGSLLGAVGYGSRTWRSPLRTRLLATTVLMALAYWLLTAQPGPWWMAALMVATGAFLAPTLAVSFSMVITLVAASAMTEAFAWLVTTFTVGAAVGSFLAGTAAASSPGSAALAAALLATGAAAVTAGAQRGWRTAGVPAGMSTGS